VDSIVITTAAHQRGGFVADKGPRANRRITRADADWTVQPLWLSDYSKSSAVARRRMGAVHLTGAGSGSGRDLAQPVGAWHWLAFAIAKAMQRWNTYAAYLQTTGRKAHQEQMP